MSGPEVGSAALREFLLNALKTERGVHLESLLACLGSVGGFSCHMAARAAMNQGELATEGGLMEVVSADGRTYYFGNAINKLLVESPFSFWNFVRGPADAAGGQLVDVDEIIDRVARSVGSEAFGLPDLPEQHPIHFPPLECVKSLWPLVMGFLAEHCDTPVEHPQLIGMTTQQLIVEGQSAISPAISTKIVMECAVPMSKVGPTWFTG